jgi:hypothetical protein
MVSPNVKRRDENLRGKPLGLVSLTRESGLAGGAEGVDEQPKLARD